MIMKSIFKASHLAALVIACVFLTASAQAQSWLTNGLVAEWKLEGDANDTIGPAVSEFVTSKLGINTLQG